MIEYWGKYAILFVSYPFFQKGVEMKKWINLMFVFIFVLAFFLAGSQKNVSAGGGEPPEPGLAPGDWVWTSAAVVGGEVPMLDILTKPASWLQLITNGLVIKAPARICHPFRGAQFGWSGSIYKLVGETWVKVPTTIGWEPSSEGKYVACAQAASAGTYALFGYWVKPAGEVEVVALPPCGDGEGFGGYSYNPSFNSILNIAAWLDTATPNIPVSYEIFSLSGPFNGDLSGSAISDGSGHVHFPDNQLTYTGLDPTFSFNIRFTSPTCYWDDTVVEITHFP
jgi:hypothetical protein